jgi:hypothetical protein
MWHHVALLAMIAGTVVAFAHQIPPRDPGPLPHVLVHGFVWSADEPQRPLPGADLTIVRDGVPSGRVSSDARGRFQLEVPAQGTATLVATKAGFAPGQWLLPSPTDHPLHVRLTPGAVLTGRVVNHLGGPAIAVGIRARRILSAGTEPVSSPHEFLTETDDRGEFRIGSLPAGRYEVTLGQAACQTLTRPSGRVACGGPAFLGPSLEPAPLADPVVLELRPREETSISLLDQASIRGPSGPTAVPAGASVIGGRVVDADGHPIHGAQV